ncbi:CPBP family glutamic-type intramembrane protease [Rhodanobacter sp. C01]|uniref:CPBP family glutamic-type intramembrane protease n=1 Tax=Rhodanobacter sp. C01 TaxID=1945856 RepID=UPI000986BFA3|nr:CPBP family glutamic-type intramembrane protease [Rhodanobacter sp. C01]OOG48016.1 abortive infection protein [Rhodanobacter sp. C01]
MPTTSPDLPVRGPHLKLALLLGIAGILAALALSPYLMALMPLKFATLPMPLWAAIAAQALQAGVLCWLLGWLGLFLGARHGLDAPWLRAWTYRRPRDPAQHANWWVAILLGAVAALLVIGIQRTGLPWHRVDSGAALGSAWRGALASFYGGIVEETECRLLLVSLFVWLLAWCNRRQARPWMFAVAIVLAALLFGAGHLPTAFAIGMAHAPLPIARIVLLNAMVGLVTGTLFWKYGLEHAMLAHFSADLVLHVGLPLVASL